MTADTNGELGTLTVALESGPATAQAKAFDLSTVNPTLVAVSNIDSC